MWNTRDQHCFNVWYHAWPNSALHEIWPFLLFCCYARITFGQASRPKKNESLDSINLRYLSATLLPWFRQNWWRLLFSCRSVRRPFRESMTDSICCGSAALQLLTTALELWRMTQICIDIQSTCTIPATDQMMHSLAHILQIKPIFNYPSPPTPVTGVWVSPPFFYVSVCFFAWYRKPMQLRSSNLRQKCFEMSPGNWLILQSKRSRSRVTKTLPAWIFALLWVLAASRWCDTISMYYCFCKGGKASHTSYQALGTELIPV